MNETPQPPPGATTPGAPGPSTGMDSFFDAIRRTGLVRSQERWIGGVGSGLALRLGIDPLIVRGVLGVSVLIGGLGLVLYGLAWLLLPEQQDGRIHAQQLVRGDFDAAVIGGLAMVVVGLAFPDRWSPFFWWSGDGSWWRGLIGLIAIALIVAVIVSAATKDRGPGPTTTLPPPGTPAPRATGPATAPPTGAPTPYPTGAPAPAAPPAAHATAPTAATAPRRPEGPTMYPAPPAPHGPNHPGPGYAAPPPRPGVPTATATAPGRKGAGPTAFGIVVALSLLTLAGLLYAERVGAFTGSVLLTTGAVAVVLSGLGIVVAGLFGRTGGGLNALAIVSIIVLLPVAMVDGMTWRSVSVGEVRATPTAVVEARAGYSLGAGEARIDLTEVPMHGDTVEVPISVGTGEVRVIIPEDTAVTARIRVTAGEVRWLDRDSTSHVGGGWQTFESDAVRRGEEPDIHLRISVGAGNVRVTESSR